MKTKLIIGLIVISLVLISGCAQIQTNQQIKEFLCKTPYIEYKTGECCLDANSNRICDKDEQQAQTNQVRQIVSTTEITVTPSVVNRGGILNFEVKVGSQGSSGMIEIYSPDDVRVAEIQLKGCGDTCIPKSVETASYKIGMDWQPGNYYVLIKDLGSREEAKVYFNVN